MLPQKKTRLAYGTDSGIKQKMPTFLTTFRLVEKSLSSLCYWLVNVQKMTPNGAWYNSGMWKSMWNPFQDGKKVTRMTWNIYWEGFLVGFACHCHFY